MKHIGHGKASIIKIMFPLEMFFKFIFPAMLRMTEDHVLPELNKVVCSSMFSSRVRYLLAELSLGGHLGLLIQLLVNRVSGCRHEASFSKPFIFKRNLHVIYILKSQNTFIMAFKFIIFMFVYDFIIHIT